MIKSLNKFLNDVKINLYSEPEFKIEIIYNYNLNCLKITNNSLKTSITFELPNNCILGVSYLVGIRINDIYLKTINNESVYKKVVDIIKNYRSKKEMELYSKIEDAFGLKIIEE